MTDNRLSDRTWRINNLYWIINAEGNKVKFKMNEAQQEFYNEMWYLNEVLKSRQHGITTFMCIFMLDACLFRSNIRAGIIAHNRTDAEVFFNDKVKFAYENIDVPGIAAMREAKTDSARELLFSNNSAIRVGTSHRSGTLQYLHVSEYGKICAKHPEKAKEIRTGALNTIHPGNFVCIESTAEGREGDFFNMDQRARNLLLEGKELTPMDYKHFFFPWWKRKGDCLGQKDTDNVIIPQELKEYFDELKKKEGIHLSPGQKAWYVKKYETQQDEMKREFPSTADEAFEAALIGAYYSKQMAKVRLESRIGEFPYNPNAVVHTGWDIGRSDSMPQWFFQINGPWIDIIDFYQSTDEAMDHHKIIMDKRGYIYGKHFAPHDIKKKDLMVSGLNRIDRASEIGIDFEKVNRTKDVIEDINEVRRMFYRFRFNEATTAEGIKALDSYRKEWNEKMGCFRELPLHNWASHPADAIRTLVHGALSLAPVPSASDNRGPYPGAPGRGHMGGSRGSQGWMGN